MYTDKINEHRLDELEKIGKGPELVAKVCSAESHDRARITGELARRALGVDPDLLITDIPEPAQSEVLVVTAALRDAALARFWPGQKVH